MTLALFIERPLGVEDWIGASHARAGMAQDVNIHILLTL
jgi:hypothetical protein